MRVRTGHGPDDWSPSVPASAQLSGIRGALVVGAPGPNDRATHNAQARKSREKKAEEAA